MSRLRPRDFAGAPPSSDPPGGRSDRGFALGLVVLLLFAIGVAAATGYQAVRVEFDLSLQGADSKQALNLARAGLSRFVSEWVGNLPDTTIAITYDFPAGEAEVTVRPIVDNGDRELYLVSSTGFFTDPRWPDRPATRTVRQHAVYHALPLLPLAALVTTSQQVEVAGGATISGFDAAPTPCGADVAGVFSRDANIQVTGNNTSLTGDPPSDRVPQENTLLDSVGVAWTILTDPTFPVEHDGTAAFPSVQSYPNDSFPAIRIQGDFSPGRDERGQGILIVTGELTPDRQFRWNGIILAGSTPEILNARNVDIEGVLVTGLNGGLGSTRVDANSFRIEYHSCDVQSAGRGIGHLEPVGNTWWEGG